MEPTKIWLTGATGFVGSHFLYHVLETSSCEVVALVRKSKHEPARARLLRTLGEVAASYRQPFHAEIAARLHVIEGDITLPACGVEVSALPAHLREGVHSLWHMAASLQFDAKYADEIELHNVTGTHNALALAAQLDGAGMVYVSTAYTCGTQTGVIPEQLHTLSREFCNVYERTKCQAEHAVAAFGREQGRSVAILRPSIVVGPRKTHLPGGSDTGLYGFTREIHRLKRMLQASKTSLVLLGEPSTPVNLIPVDDAAREMWSLAQRRFDQQLVHHVVSAEHPDVGALLRAVARHCEVLPIEAQPVRSLPPSPVEQAIDRRAVFYASYLRNPKQFARASVPALCVSEDDLDHLVREYARQRRSESLESTLTRHTIEAPGRRSLVSFSSGGPDARPTLVLCNALGIASEVWVPLAQALAPSMRVLTWELRAPARSGDQPLAVRDHADDLRRVLDAHGVRRAYVAGWCTGADVAVAFAAQHASRVCGLISLHGALNGASSERTGFQESLRKMVVSVASDVRRASFYHGLLFGQRRPHYGVLMSAGDRDEVMLSSMIESLDPALLHLTSAPFRDAASLYAYSVAMCAYYGSAEAVQLPDVRVPALVVTGSADIVAHPDASRAAARAWSRAQLLDVADGDHFSVYHDARIASAVATFVRELEAESSLRAEHAAA